MIYGKVRFPDRDKTATATLTEGVWECPESPMMADVFNEFHAGMETSPSLGDPIANHINRMAAMVKGTAEITPLEPAPAGVMY